MKVRNKFYSLSDNQIESYIIDICPGANALKLFFNLICMLKTRLYICHDQLFPHKTNILACTNKKITQYFFKIVQFE